ncbi:MAG: hypothetical protein NTV88_01275 [Candidatus Micrarchaeota archaeon]|nr:hypothetical protein [Candidatus Micrarchaeota archaeon]
MPYCLVCGTDVDELDSAYYSRSMLCIPCWTRKSSEVAMAGCSRCGTRMRQDEVRRKNGNIYCSYCFNELERIERIPVCTLCKKNMETWHKTLRLSNGKNVHQECAVSPKYRVKVFCSICGTETDYFKLSPAGFPYCHKCDKSPGAASASGDTGVTVTFSHEHPLLESLVGKIGAMLG